MLSQRAVHAVAKKGNTEMNYREKERHKRVENSRSVLSLVSWSMVYLGRGATPG
jgi:hypothetical protein